MATNWPKPGTKLHDLLEAVCVLSKNSSYGHVHVTEIYLKTGGARESTRTMLSILKNRGLLSNPHWGYYAVTDKGVEALTPPSGAP